MKFLFVPLDKIEILTLYCKWFICRINFCIHFSWLHLEISESFLSYSCKHDCKNVQICLNAKLKYLQLTLSIFCWFVHANLTYWKEGEVFFLL